MISQQLLADHRINQSGQHCKENIKGLKVSYQKTISRSGSALMELHFIICRSGKGVCWNFDVCKDMELSPEREGEDLSPKSQYLLVDPDQEEHSRVVSPHKEEPRKDIAIVIHKALHKDGAVSFPVSVLACFLWWP